MSNKQKKNVPELRFPGFEGEWEEKKLGEVGTFTSGGTPLKSKSEYWNGDIPWITTGDIHNIKRENITNFITEKGLNESSAKLITNEAILIAMYGQGKTRGMSAILNFEATTNQACAIYQTNQNINFVFQYFQKLYEFLRSLSNEGSQKNLSLSLLKEITLNYPNEQEQKKIGDFFSKLDRQIELEEQKLELLQQQKKGYMQKIFSQELRFKDENGNDYPDWEEKQLGELSQIVRGASPRPIKDPKWFNKESDIGWLRISDVTNQNGKIYHLEQKLSIEGQEKTRVLVTTHLLLSIAASIGKPVMNFVKTGVHDGFLIFLNPKFNLFFMYYWLEYFKDKWSKYGQPGSQVNLNTEIVKSQTLNMPSNHEQEKVGQFFNRNEKLIELQQEKIMYLKRRKQVLLQKMFI
ncbi:TPA: restriction endonuclease subunit S [Staphylococcus aureus]|uniref:restriction endonuclease subunit S n=3 Tax=Staphylococcus aureus TaxID=1280 RepID=UPI0007CA6133|nr:restriction endonuclease subunit S [Staphylococcus aureus]MCC1257707.1 restriction endonuclease subunit S [Staphylococcus aureus]MVJ07119.1 restriction endonuclease subunit S [Staphylococcus aureus]SBE62010.1 restriction-modification system%2C S subunit [Staphylococcus aureus]HBC4048743.1 restriction endonuclease subunit S [Staphylococcus aureus]HCY5050767.1 restriction endonuclease subunit S [Staphylococcus aureus]